MAKKESEKYNKAIYDEDTHLASSNDTGGAVRGDLLDNETNKPVGNVEFIEIAPNEIYNQGYNDVFIIDETTKKYSNISRQKKCS